MENIQQIFFIREKASIPKHIIKKREEKLSTYIYLCKSKAQQDYIYKKILLSN